MRCSTRPAPAAKQAVLLASGRGAESCRQRRYYSNLLRAGARRVLEIVIAERHCRSSCDFPREPVAFVDAGRYVSTMDASYPQRLFGRLLFTVKPPNAPKRHRRGSRAKLISMTPLRLNPTDEASSAPSRTAVPLDRALAPHSRHPPRPVREGGTCRGACVSGLTVNAHLTGATGPYRRRFTFRLASERRPRFSACASRCLSV